MKSRISLVLLTIVLALNTGVRGQESHVEIRYDKGTDMTVVTSDVLYVINMPTQFMQVQLTGRYPKPGKPTQRRGWVSLQFFSYAPQPLYQKDDAHRLQVKAGEKVLDLGLLVYSKINPKYEDNEGQTRSNSAARAGLPASALVRDAAKKDGLTLEMMSVRNLGLADLKAMATADSVVMKIGPSVFPLKPMHLTILRQFVDAVGSSAVEPIAVKTVETPAVPADVPSDANKASLDETLKWLKSHLDRHSSDRGANVLISLETLKFKDCTIRYRLMPRVKNPPNSTALDYVVPEYQINLADLNPEIVVVANFGEFATVSMTTRDVQPKIKVLDHKNEWGTMGRTVDERQRSSAAITFKTLAAAASFKVALIHGINLCTR